MLVEFYDDLASHPPATADGTDCSSRNWTNRQSKISNDMARVPGIGLLNRTLRAGWKGTRFNSSAGFQDYGCVAQTGLERASHKREVGGSIPPAATKIFGLVM